MYAGPSWVDSLGSQNEDKNEESLRENKKKLAKFREKENSGTLSHLRMWDWICPCFDPESFLIFLNLFKDHSEAIMS